MSAKLEEIGSYIVLTLVLGFVAFQSMKHSEDPARTGFKWLLTVGIIAFVRWKAFDLADKGGLAAFYGVAVSAVGGLVLFITWRQEIGSVVAKPFVSLYSGGDEPPEPRPFYSIARARQKQGKYADAVEEIRKQLERFPTDFEGHMLMAEIQAQDLKD